jgi:hypothetical protein
VAVEAAFEAGDFSTASDRLHRLRLGPSGEAWDSSLAFPVRVHLLAGNLERAAAAAAASAERALRLSKRAGTDAADARRLARRSVVMRCIADSLTARRQGREVSGDRARLYSNETRLCLALDVDTLDANERAPWLKRFEVSGRGGRLLGNRIEEMLWIESSADGPPFEPDWHRWYAEDVSGYSRSQIHEICPGLELSALRAMERRGAPPLPSDEPAASYAFQHSLDGLHASLASFELGLWNLAAAREHFDAVSRRPPRGPAQELFDAAASRFMGLEPSGPDIVLALRSGDVASAERAFVDRWGADVFEVLRADPSEMQVFSSDSFSSGPSYMTAAILMFRKNHDVAGARAWINWRLTEDPRGGIDRRRAARELEAWEIAATGSGAALARVLRESPELSEMVPIWATEVVSARHELATAARATAGHQCRGCPTVETAVTAASWMGVAEALGEDAWARELRTKVQRFREASLRRDIAVPLCALDALDVATGGE